MTRQKHEVPYSFLSKVGHDQQHDLTVPGSERLSALVELIICFIVAGIVVALAGGVGLLPLR